MTIRTILTVSATTLIAATPSACSAKANSESLSSEIKTTVVGLPDGRGLTCAIYAPNSDIGTIDCDWARAREGLAADPDTPLAARVIVAPDGRSVICAIYAANSSSGSISCDWTAT